MSRVFTCTNFTGYWPVGSAAVIVAENEDQARDLLYLKLNEIGLGKDVPSRYEIIELDLANYGATILVDGNY